MENQKDSLPVEKKCCEKRWTERTPETQTKISVVCGAPLPCKEHSTETNSQDSLHSQDQSQLESKIEDWKKKFDEMWDKGAFNWNGEKGKEINLQRVWNIFITQALTQVQQEAMREVFEKINNLHEPFEVYNKKFSAGIAFDGIRSLAKSYGIEL